MLKLLVPLHAAPKKVKERDVRVAEKDLSKDTPNKPRTQLPKRRNLVLDVLNRTRILRKKRILLSMPLMDGFPFNLRQTLKMPPSEKMIPLVMWTCKCKKAEHKSSLQVKKQPLPMMMMMKDPLKDDALGYAFETTFIR